MPDFIPTREDERDDFFENFCRWLELRGGDFGLSEEEVRDLSDRRRGSTRARAAYKKMRQAAKEARSEKDDVMAHEEALVRALFRRLEAHPEFTNEDRHDLGKRLSREESSSGGTMLSPPKLHPMAVEGRADRIRIHWGSNPEKGGNGKPVGAWGAAIQFAVGKKPPTDPDAWRALPPTGMVIETPVQHEVGPGKKRTFHYRAAYVNNRARLMSAWCDPVRIDLP